MNRFIFSAILFFSAASAHAADEASLSLLNVGLQDGHKWVLGPGGIGRPFMARLLLSNSTKAPITIWDYKNTEGSTCPGIILTDEKGNETVLRPLPIERAAGIPTVITIEPTKIIVIELELLRLIGEKSLPPGKYKLRAFYENKLDSDFGFIKAKIWTGRIESPVAEIEIVSPAPVKAAGGSQAIKTADARK